MFRGFIKTAAASPQLRVADVEYNVCRIIEMMNTAYDAGVKLLVFPELCITGASCGDIFRQQRLIDAARDGLQDIIDASTDMDMVIFVGLPYEKDGKLYDVTAAVKDGSLLGIIPKSNVRAMNELNQIRVFEDGQEIPEIIDTGLFYGIGDEELFDEEGLTEEDLSRISSEPGKDDFFRIVDDFEAETGEGEEASEEVSEGNTEDHMSDADEEDIDDDGYCWCEDEDEYIAETIEAPFGVNIVFECTEFDGLSIAVEMGEERKLLYSPGARHATAGAQIIVNPCAVPALAGSLKDIEDELKAYSSRICAAYVRAGAGCCESTTDYVFDGSRIITENGSLLTSDTDPESGILITDIDFEMLRIERKNNSAFIRMDEQDADEDYIFVGFEYYGQENEELDRIIEKNPFVPASREEELCESILDIQARALAKRLEHTRSKRIVIGLSGGLDSTLTLLAALRAAEINGFGPEYILCLSMPAFGTSEQTRSNLNALASATGVELREINLKESLLRHFADIGHAVDVHDSAYENAQARERTQVLMDIANMEGGIVVGTGDLSEAALGWCTYNGDQMSMYVVNADVPKTVIRQIVGWTARTTDNKALSEALLAVLGTPISPELLPVDAQGQIGQRTEDIVGPYELHDFFIYYMLRYGYSPERIVYLAENAFRGQFGRSEIIKWLGVLYSRFFASQFKRSACVDGPKVFSVDLSPRGELCMPSDAVGELWKKEIELLKFADETELL